jgi:hypothetical protein
VRVTAAWLADRRGIALDELGTLLIAAYDHTIPREERPT